MEKREREWDADRRVELAFEARSGDALSFVQFLSREVQRTTIVDGDG
jgi:hypothetical protein